MKKLIILFAAAVMAVSVMASEVKIDKENCTVTKDGKTYKLYGKVKIVENMERNYRRA